MRHARTGWVALLAASLLLATTATVAVAVTEPTPAGSAAAEADGCEHPRLDRVREREQDRDVTCDRAGDGLRDRDQDRVGADTSRTSDGCEQARSRDNVRTREHREGQAQEPARARERREEHAQDQTGPRERTREEHRGRHHRHEGRPADTASRQR